MLIVVLAGSWLAPDVPADLTGTRTCSCRPLRSGQVEQCHRNLTDHWVTAESGIHDTGVFPVLSGGDVVVEFALDQIEGSVGCRLVHYAWGF